MKDLIQQHRSFFQSGETLSYAFRIEQLKRLDKALKAYEDRLYHAIDLDFGKSRFDTYTTELALLEKDIKQAIKRLKYWMAPKSVRTNVLNFPARSEIRTEPLGVSLVIGAWNYPYLLSLGPVVAALAAGCTVVLKPSELASNTSRVMAQMISEHFDSNCLTVVEGGVPETTSLLEQRFDKIFFTGSTRVGKIVYGAAARHLTPVTLELGGKSPAIITPSAKLNMAIKRLVWGKFINAGQTCVSPDYVLVHESIADEVVERIIREIELEQFSVEHQNFPRIINDQNYERLMGLIEQDQVRLGGNGIPEQRIIQPTVLYPANWEQAAMQEEIFGPILPILTYQTLDEAIDKLNAAEKPLAAYFFGQNKKERQRFMSEFSFGGGAIDETIMHMVNPDLPFGGVGSSGTGSYHGEAGFLAFSHQKSILIKPNWFELPLKYYPRSEIKLTWIRQFFKI